MPIEHSMDNIQKALNKAHSALNEIQKSSSELIQDAAITVNTNTSLGIDPIVFWFSIFILAIFVGYFVIWSVTPALHTPLMAVTNAISSVIIVGALLAVGVASLDSGSNFSIFLGFLGLILVGINIVGGFYLTHRMLEMYKKKTG